MAIVWRARRPRRHRLPTRRGWLINDREPSTPTGEKVVVVVAVLGRLFALFDCMCVLV